ncbi:WNT1-inducible-signaling pathway protein 2 precursor [Silurus asotus]|uniref:WNT1-inducible-signaling pathway protein 2 n=1 Tax=Silurus asotus TaxID=30991 RepID=A0AAD5AWI2_SILAS|nr:WNT1-inducible-signaling pathway protein 2 precursor [Silurus asotus]
MFLLQKTISLCSYSKQTHFKWVILQVTCRLCSGLCQCPSSPASCPLGVPLVPDGCRCCQICAGQEGEACSEKDVCDTQRGLECDYSGSFPDGPGECVQRNTLGCEYLGVSYEEGQSFIPSCRQLCRCVGGGVTCVPLCTEDLNTANCQHPRLVHVPGRCCREWVCDGTENSIVLENAAVDRGVRSWQDTPVHRGVSCCNCIKQSTEWSVCSRSCGPGVSTRVSNRNLDCQPQTYTRLCVVRPCDRGPTARTHLFQKLGVCVCVSSYRSTTPVQFEHQGCYSSRSYKPLFCGTCSDGRCCSPEYTRTALVTFVCPWGRITQHAVMMIESCICHYNCPHNNISRRTRSWL